MAYNPYDTAALRNNKRVLAFSPDNRRFVDPNYYLDVTWDGRGWKATGYLSTRFAGIVFE